MRRERRLPVLVRPQDGITPFFIPPGPYLMSMEPFDGSGAEIAADMVDPPLVGLRSVVKGLSRSGRVHDPGPCAIAAHGGNDDGLRQ